MILISLLSRVYNMDDSDHVIGGIMPVLKLERYSTVDKLT